MSVLFWVSLVLLVYPLAGYPLILGAARLFARTPRPADSAYTPRVSVLLSVYNEENVIAGKIRNFLDQDYPEDNLELLIVSDASEDGTDTAIAPFMSERVRLLRQEQRGGKTTALNRAVQEARGEILFFTDADSMLRADCLRILVRSFADPSVGLVSGRSLYLDESGRETGGSLYRRYEEWLKEHEGALFGIAGADGAVYAMRKSLYRHLPPDHINDLAHPMHVVLEGGRAVAQPGAVVTEPDSHGSGAFARQTRIMAQSWRIFLAHARPLLKAKRYGYLWQFLSHKVLRWLALPWLILLAVSAWSLAGALPALALAGLVLLCALAALDSKAGKSGRLAGMFLLQSLAGSYGLLRLLRGQSFVTWNPRGK